MSVETLSKPIVTLSKISKNNKKIYTVASLFAGIGGICSAFVNANFKIAWANEIDKQACITYMENFNHKLYEDDIHNLDPNECPKADIIVAGFPCQAFSIAGYQKGFNDNRGILFFEILRFIDSHKPICIFLENVKNIVSHNKGNL